MAGQGALLTYLKWFFKKYGETIIDVGGNALADWFNRRQEQKFDIDKYAQQRKDAIADRDYNRQMYFENREYNEPQNQMARLMSAGISPFGQNFANVSSGAFDGGQLPSSLPDSSIMHNFASLIKSASTALLSKRERDFLREAQREKLRIQEDTLNETKRFHDLLNATNNAKIDLGYFSARNNYGLGLLNIEQRIKDRDAKYNWLKTYNTTPGYLGYEMAQDTANRVKWRNQSMPHQIEGQKLRNEYQRTSNLYQPILLNQSVDANTYRNFILRNNLTTSGLDLDLRRSVQKRLLKDAKYQERWGRHVGNIRENIGMLHELNSLVDEVLNTALNVSPYGKYGFMRNIKSKDPF